ncbi:MAG: ABC transporter ATP-binding protein [Spirochaetaceae bacterium]|jgi:iron complex transport system ATP-binding protein|nr:ABC transporter ATP-binding protein [Spirochaetaceae bacterium]
MDGKNMLLNCTKVNAGYGGAPVIKEISFSLEAGAMLCIAGPNGSGKSTLLKALAAMVPYQGTVMLNGREARALKRRELGRHIALLSQMPQVYFPYTVYDTVALARYAYAGGVFKTITKQDEEIIRRVLAELELDTMSNKMLDELSGGQLQRVYLARTIAQDPDIILLDEPTNHLDLKYQIELLRYLSIWVKKGQKAVAGVLHDLNLALAFFNEVILMRDGCAVLQGTAKALFTGNNLKDIYEIDIQEFMLSSLKNWKPENTAYD